MKKKEEEEDKMKKEYFPLQRGKKRLRVLGVDEQISEAGGVDAPAGLGQRPGGGEATAKGRRKGERE